MLLAKIFTDDICALRRGAPDPSLGSERERIARLADRAARSAAPVLIESEPGSGAHDLARAIHDGGERRQRPFIRIHGGDPHEGDDADAFLARHLRDAHGGTLLVQDVERLNSSAQARLFEIIAAPDAAPRGTRLPSRPDVRIMATTGFALADEVRRARFREDLYYRLQVMPISLRPLRTRRDEIADLAGLFLHRFAADEGKRIRGLSPDASTLLSRYDWPGNLRQLENAVFRAVALAEGPVLTPAEFPQIAAHVQGFRIEIPRLPQATAPAPVQEAPAPGRRDPHALPLMNDSGEMRTLAELEAQAIRFALAHYQGHLSAISRRLGIGRSTLYRKLKELGLDDAAA
ncbi:sigma-54-dependent transcriptional regulator [Microvirga sp. GCM10011540]|uniref:sigma-54-dependent transcriptional regulator n=1 Tax=Microvirga sp. GCM10011540 TaxID=3317338 RepID=UPI00361855D3